MKNIKELNTDEIYKQANKISLKVNDEELDYSLDSLDLVEEIIEFVRRNEDILNDTVRINAEQIFGIYCGEVYLRDSLDENGFYWDLDEEGMPCLSNGKEKLFPINKIHKKINYINSDEGTLLHYYGTFLEMLKMDQHDSVVSDDVVVLGNGVLIPNQEWRTDAIRKFERYCYEEDIDKADTQLKRMFDDKDLVLICSDKEKALAETEEGCKMLIVYTSIDIAMENMEESEFDLIEIPELFDWCIKDESIKEIVFNPFIFPEEYIEEHEKENVSFSPHTASISREEIIEKYFSMK